MTIPIIRLTRERILADAESARLRGAVSNGREISFLDPLQCRECAEILPIG